MTNDPHKNKKPAVKSPEEKFAEEQAYSEQDYHLVDPEKETPETPEEKGIGSAEDESTDSKQNSD